MSISSAVCLSLLLSGGPDVAPATPPEETAVREWLKDRNVVAPRPGQIDDTFKQWKIWATSTAAARNANLALELKNISPPGEEPALVSLDGRAQLEKISRANLERLKEEITSRLPLARPAPAEIVTKVGLMSGQIAFNYLHRYDVINHTGVYEPLASSRELKKIGLDFNPSYYSRLSGGAASVPFAIVAARKHGSPFSLNAQVPFTALRVNDQLASEAGFVLPNISTSNGLLTFFSEWEPATIEKLFKQTRAALPHGVDSVQKFLLYLDPQTIKEVFPDDAAFGGLALLRERLIRYALTEADARELLIWAFERWLTSEALNDPAEFGRLLTEFTLPAGPQAVFAQKFLVRLALPPLALRVPLAVGPQSYSILRVENRAYNPFPERGGFHQPRWDSRRLDHRSRP